MYMLRLLSLSVLLTVTAFAQEFTPSYTINGDLRIRSEVDGRDFNLRTPPNAYTLSRARLAVDARPATDVTLFFQVRDSRAFGSIANTLGDAKSLDLHQGYVRISHFLSDNLSAKLGRQEVSFGTERIIGTVGWHNVGRVFDGARLTFATATFTVDGLAFNTAEVQPYQPVATPAAVASVPDAGSDLYGLYASYKGVADLTLEGYGLYQSDRNQTIATMNDLSRFTLGGHAAGKMSGFDYDAEVAYQMGKRRGTDVSAYMMALDGGYAVDVSFLKRLAVGYEVLSGTPATASKHQSFDPMYHTGHKFYGFMDYFIGFPGNTADRGLVDLFGRVQMSFSSDMAGNVWIHSFAHAEKVGTETALGQELDCDLQYRYNSRVVFQAGLSAFLPANIMRQRFGGAGTAYWAYLQTSVSF